MGFDWIIYFYPALQVFLRGGDPYSVPGYVNPPWLLVFLAPLGLLPPEWGAVGMDVATLIGLGLLCRKMGRPRLMIPLAVSFPMVVLLWVASVDGLSLWGIALGGPLGLILLLTKPQVAALVGGVWAWTAWREGGWRKVAVLIVPAIVVALISIWLYPNWLPTMFNASGWAHRTTGFPWYFPIGVAMFVTALRQKREDWAAFANLMVSPFATPQSWVAAFSTAWPIRSRASSPWRPPGSSPSSS
jgi:hypothetical protein